MKLRKFKEGISLITLVITIIVVIILAAVIILSIQKNNPVGSASMASFLNNIAKVEEGVSLYRLSNNNKSPVTGAVDADTLENNSTLEDEIAFYRTWQQQNQKPTETSTGIITVTPNGVVDLYYIDQDKIGFNSGKKQKYILDKVTGIIYEIDGVKKDQTVVHSKYAALGKDPSFEVADVEEDKEVAKMGYKLITKYDSGNIYKLYDNGDLYGIGVKGSEINTSPDEMEKIDTLKWVEYNDPKEITAGVKETYQCTDNSVAFLDNNNELWGIGDNTYNMFGLSEEQLKSYTGRKVIKLNVDGKKVSKVFPGRYAIFVITEDNKLYSAGYNADYELGLGHNNTVYGFTNVQVNNVENVKEILPSYDSNFTIIWYNDNTFYFVGNNHHGQLGIGTSGETYQTFTQIWNSEPYDIDQDIQDLLVGSSIMILKKDGTIWQAGYRGSSGGSGGGEDLTGDQKIFQEFPENFGSNVEKIYQLNSARLITRKNEDGKLEVWGAPGNVNNLGLDSSKYNSTKYFKISLTEELEKEGIKSIFTAKNNVYYISNKGNVYASGDPSYLGKGDLIKLDEVIKLDGLKNIERVYFSKSKNVMWSDSIIFEDTNGKKYTTGNKVLIYGNAILQNTWSKVANNVKYFFPGLYIDKDNDLYVTGDDSTILGLNESVSRQVNNYTKVNDQDINGKVEIAFKASMWSSNYGIYLKTTDQKLYATGKYMADSGVSVTYGGWNDKTDKFNFIELNDDISNLFVYGKTRFLIKENNLYGWGNNYGNILGMPGNNEGVEVPTKVDLDESIDVKNIIKVVGSDYQAGSIILSKDGKLYVVGNASKYTGIENSTSFTKLDYNFNNEKILDFSRGYNANYTIVLTENGNLYGWGAKKALGIKDSSNSYTDFIVKLPIDNVKEILTGSNFAIAVKNDGTVWGTGSNANGVLGRWIDKNGNYASSNFETAFEWVRCPHLEM